MFMHKAKPAHPLVCASAVQGREVCNPRGEDLGDIRELMIDLDTGRVVYAVLSFGGFLSLGDKRFAVPWSALSLDRAKNQFVLNMDQDSLLHVPKFDHDHWPDMTDPAWGVSVADHFTLPAAHRQWRDHFSHHDRHLKDSP